MGVIGGMAGCLGSDGGSRADPQSTERSPTDQSSTESTESSGAPFEHPGTLDQSFATNGEYPSDAAPADGRPPDFSEQPAEPDVDPSTFETLEVNGESVRLVPIDVAHTWYRRGDVRVVDARGLDSYTQAHIYGAVFSKYQDGSTGGGIDGWDTADRVVTYCMCPHHMSTVRAAGLQKAGYSDVYAIDEGFRPWFQREYPMAGTSFARTSQAQLSKWTIQGTVPSAYTGGTARAATGRQYEERPIRADGSYELDLYFWNVDESTPVEVSTPAYTVTRPLGELSAEPIEGPGKL